MEPWDCVETVEISSDLFAPADEFCGRCSICGEIAANFTQNDDEFPSSSQTSNQNVASTLFECMSDFETDVSNNGIPDASLNLDFCDACKSYLTEWRESTTKIEALLERTRRIKWTLVAKLLTQYSQNIGSNSVKENSAPFGSPKLTHLVGRLVKQFLAKVVLGGTESVRAGGIRTEEKQPNDVNSPVDVENFNESDLDDDLVHDPDFDEPAVVDAQNDEDEPSPQKAPIEPEKKKSQGGQSQLPLVKMSSSIWLYADKYKFTSLKNNKYRCDQCHMKVSMRNNMLRHIRRLHIFPKETRKKRKPPLKAVEGSQNEFLFREKYAVTYIEDSNKYQCSLCQYLGDGEDRIVNHIKLKHIFTPKTPYSSITKVSPDEYLYKGKYQIHYDSTDQVYSCGVCGLKYGDLRAVLPHVRQAHYTEEDKIEFSAVQVSDTDYLYAGKYPIRFGSEGRFHCGLCGRTSDHLSGLYGHIQANHLSDDPTQHSLMPSSIGTAETNANAAPETFQCRGIPYTLDPSTRMFVCSVCSKAVKHKGSMTMHIRNYHLEPPGQYVCDRCGDSFQSQRLLKEHRGRHGDPKYQCGYCGKFWRDVKNFKAHVAVHEKGEEAKKFVCEYCGKRFVKKNYLINHVRIHTGEKPFECVDCGQRFSDSARVSLHRKAVHGYVPKRHALD